MNIDKKIVYLMITYGVVSLLIAIISIVIALRPDPLAVSTSQGFKMIQNRLDSMEVSLIREQVLIDTKLDSLNSNQTDLNEDLIKYSYDLKRSVNKIKRYKNEIIHYNYRDSSTIAIINRLNSTK